MVQNLKMLLLKTMKPTPMSISWHSWQIKHILLPTDPTGFVSFGSVWSGPGNQRFHAPFAVKHAVETDDRADGHGCGNWPGLFGLFRSSGRKAGSRRFV